jgi:hypothetical protein
MMLTEITLRTSCGLIRMMCPGTPTPMKLPLLHLIPLANARSLLATGYVMAGEVSEYGPGNPRQTISWRSYSVSKGQTIKMGIEWKRGQAVATPFPIRQANRPL